MRPASIRRLGAIYLAWMAAAICWECWVVATFAAAHSRTGMTFPIMMGCLITLHLVLNLLLWRYIVVRPRPIARTVFAVLMLIGWIYFFYTTALRYRSIPMTASMGAMTLSFLVQLGMLWLLFQPDASAWLRGEGPQSPEALEDTFR
jgi:hypothetical protein